MGGAELPFKRFLVKQPGIPGKAWIAVADRKRKFYSFRKAGCFEAQGSLPVRALPSTSPANAAWSLERLTDAWRAIL